MDEDVYIIAEVGINHNGDYELAEKMIRKLADTGTDAVKFQKSIPEISYANDRFMVNYLEDSSYSDPQELCAKHQLTEQEHKEAYELCEELGVDYLCSAFEHKSLEFLDQTFDLEYFKIPSGELVNVDILDYCSESDTPVLLSTGMAELSEIRTAVDRINNNSRKDITILHCVSNYPCPPEDVNLNFMETLREEFDYPLGFSDHTLGPECALGAVARGAVVIEKHVTLDRSLPGPDHKASATIGEFADYVNSIRKLEDALGSHEKSFSQDEKEIREYARKSVVASKKIAQDEKITRDKIQFRRPGIGISPFDLDMVEGRKADSELSAGEIIMPEMLK